MTEIKLKYENDTDKIDCSLTDQAGGAISLAGFTNIYCYLQHSECDYEAARYAMFASSGYDHLDFHVDNMAGGEFHIDVQNDVIKPMKKGLYKIIFELLSTNAEFDSGYETETIEEVYLERK